MNEILRRALSPESNRIIRDAILWWDIKCPDAPEVAETIVTKASTFLFKGMTSTVDGFGWTVWNLGELFSWAVNSVHWIMR